MASVHIHKLPPHSDHLRPGIVLHQEDPGAQRQWLRGFDPGTLQQWEYH